MCTTNPTFGRRIGVVLRTVAGLADALTNYPARPEAASLAMHRADVDHVRPWYVDQAAADTARLVYLRHSVFGEPAPLAPWCSGNRVTFAELRRPRPSSLSRSVPSSGSWA